MNYLYDIVIAGGGPAGVGAAISAAKKGSNVLLVERYGFLGGNLTAGLVTPLMPYYTTNKFLQNGIFLEIIEELKKSKSYGGIGDTDSFDTETMKFILQNKVLESGCELLLHTLIGECKVEDGELKSIKCYTKSGIIELKAKIFIDCTGDADVAVNSGFKYEEGRAEDNKSQPMTLMFKLANVSKEYKGVEIPVEDECLPQSRILFFGTPRKGVVSVNMTRVSGLSGVNVHDLTAAEIEARNQIPMIIDYLKANVLGFENCYLSETATCIGVRESRRINGYYKIDKKHVMSYKKSFDDVAYCNFKIDIHQPSGKGTDITQLEEEDYYGIPFRSLVPLNSKNLIVAGRPICSTHEAHASLRIMPTCFGMGESSGKIAAYCIEKNKNIPDILLDKSVNNILGELL